MMRQLIIFFSTVCYVGKIPIAPGTWGTAVGVGIYWLIRYLPAPAYVVTVIGFIFFSIWVSTKAQTIFGETDPQRVVIDEVAGYLVTMAFHPQALPVAIAGFILFRIFDITKPPPVRWMERRFSDGRGIVLDDVFAGIYANAALWLFGLIIPSLGIKWA